MESLTFKCNTKIEKIDSITVRETYRGMMVGEPDERVNKMMIESFVGMSEELLQQIDPFIFPIVDTDSSITIELPKYICGASLKCYGSVESSDADYSYAVLVWFQDVHPLFHGFKLHELIRGYTWKDVSNNGRW